MVKSLHVFAVYRSFHVLLVTQSALHNISFLSFVSLRRAVQCVLPGVLLLEMRQIVLRANAWKQLCYSVFSKISLGRSVQR